MKILLAFLAAAVVLSGAGAPTSTSSQPGSAGVSSSSRPLPDPTASAHTSLFSPVPLTRLARGRLLPGKQPFFRGGVRSRAAAAAAPAGTLSPQTGAASGGRAALFGGVNSPGMASDGLEVPPDSTGAIGPSNYVEMDNSNISVYDRQLNQVSSATLNAFAGSSGAAWCDVQIQWDQAAGRWLMAFLLCNAAPVTGGQGFIMAWSKTADPSSLAITTGGWCAIPVSTQNNFLDFPKIGHNSSWMIVGGNLYDESTSNSNPPFVSAAVAWLQLPANGVTACPSPSSVTFNGTTKAMVNGDGTTPTFTPVPVDTTSSSSDGYVVSAYDPAGNVVPPNPQQKLAVWHVDAGGGFHQDPDITVNSYAFPPAAKELGSTNLIDTLDGRLTQAVGDPTSGIWTQHTVKNGTVSKVTWYELALSGGSLAKSQEGDITNGSDFVFNGAVSPTFAGTGAAVIEYNRSSSTIDPLIAARTRWSTTPAGTFAADEVVLATSPAADVETLSCNFMGFPCRWGDYSAATPDPVNNYVVWGTNEINTAATTAPAWRDQNFAVAAWVPPGTPANVVASAGNGNACIGWAPSTVDNGTPDLSSTINVYQGVTLVKSVVVAAPASSACISGLTNGLPYTFTVTDTNAAGHSPESAHSGAVTPSREPAQAQAAPTPSPRPGVGQSTPSPPPPR